jgi:RimJ/RimL family protein N-acetyltransferase
MGFPPALLPHHTERLVLRRFDEGDLQALVDYRNDPEVARYQGWSAFTPAEAQRFIREVQHASIGVPGAWFQVAIAARHTNRLLGDIGFCVDADQPTQMELGFTLARTAQGQGYAREAVHAWLALVFQHTPITQVLAITDSRNNPSRKLLQALGMVWVRTDEREFKGEVCLEETYLLTAADCQHSNDSA